MSSITNRYTLWIVITMILDQFVKDLRSIPNLFFLKRDTVTWRPLGIVPVLSLNLTKDVSVALCTDRASCMFTQPL